MTFAGPLWLIGLVPWAAAAVYLLLGRRRQEAVPFLDLWLGPVEGARAQSKLTAPPLAVALGLLAALLALLAAARPGVSVGRLGEGLDVRIVVDCGASMSARGSAGTPRFVEAAGMLAEELRKRSPGAQLDLYVVPQHGDVVRTTAADLLGAVRGLPRTAIDTASLLGATVASLRGSAGPIVVVSDRPLGIADGKTIEVAPGPAPANAGIVLAAVRESPKPQAMVRVAGTGGATRARVEVTTAETTVAADVKPGATDVFLDLPRLGDVVKVRLLPDDGFEADNVAWLVREGSWPSIEPRAGLSPELARMVQVYAKARPAGEGSARVAVVEDLKELPPGGPGVVVARMGSGDAAGQGGVADIEVVPHPVTRGLGGGFGLRGARLAASPPDGWTPVLRVGGKVMAAVREEPVRQVWVGFDSPQWPRGPKFVVFWTDVFDWVGGGGAPEYRASPVGGLSAAWRRVDGEDQAGPPGLWPGLFERAEDGARRAVNALDVRSPEPGAGRGGDWREQVDRALAGATPGTPLAPLLLIASLGCVLGSVLCWRKVPSQVPAVAAGAAAAGRLR